MESCTDRFWLVSFALTAWTNSLLDVSAREQSAESVTQNRWDEGCAGSRGRNVACNLKVKRNKHHHAGQGRAAQDHD